MSLVHINWRPDAKELRKFGITVLIGFAIIGTIVFFTAKTPVSAYWLWGIGTVFGIAGLTGTAIAHPFYFAWMGVAFVIGNIMSRVIMVLVYFLVVTPIGLLMRMTGRDRLRLKKTKEDTYWTDAPHCNKDSYHRQF